MATTRKDIDESMTATDPMYDRPVSNDTLLDIEVGKEAERQKAETGKSEDSAAIKARLMADGDLNNVKNPKSMEEDMRLGHEDTVIAKQEDAKNLGVNAQAEADRLAEEAEGEEKKAKK